MIELAKIRTDGGTQSRAAINEETVAEYAEAMERPETVFPPVIVYYDGREYWLADGFHRVEAWRRVGRIEVPAEIRQGDRRQAILHSCAANAAHGLRRTNADKRRAVWTLVADAEWGEWSDRQIAKQCGVSHTLVANMRREISGEEMPKSGNGCHFEARSRADQESGTAPDGQENKGSEPKAEAEIGDIGTAQSKPDQETPSGPVAAPEGQPAPEQADAPQGSDGAGEQDQSQTGAEPEPDPYGYAKLTEEALLDTANGLRADLEDERAAHRKTKAKLKDANGKLADHTADDKDEVIRRLQAKVKHAEGQRYQAEEKFAAEKRKTFRLKKRVAELENEEVALN